jgi:hypothetical protein
MQEVISCVPCCARPGHLAGITLYAPPVHMIKLTETREITPYKWVHPDEER